MWVFLMALKSDACVIIKHFVSCAEINLTLKNNNQNDNGKECVNNNLETYFADKRDSSSVDRPLYIPTKWSS